MAIYKEADWVRRSTSAAFDREMRSGAEAPYEGIYRCEGCGMERSIPGGRLLPGTSQVRHPAWCTGVTWRLLVATSANSKPPKRTEETNAGSDEAA